MSSISSNKAPEPVGHYPHARRVGDLLFLSGVGPRERGTKKIPGVELKILNPDDKGVPMIETHVVATKTVQSVLSCTDNNQGSCGRIDAATGGFTGHCVCSGVKPGPHAANNLRKACPGTRDDSVTAPKCFGATQPGLQSCRASTPLADEDCDGTAPSCAAVTTWPSGARALLMTAPPACRHWRTRCQRARSRQAHRWTNDQTKDSSPLHSRQ